MNSPETPQLHLKAPLTYPEVITGLRAKGDVLVMGEGAEADADRLMLEERWAEARDIYQTLEIDCTPRREKLAFCRLAAGDDITIELMGEGVEDATTDGLLLHICACSESINDRFYLDAAVYVLALHSYIRAKASDFPNTQKIVVMSQCVYLAYLASLRLRETPAKLPFNDFLPVACEDLEQLGAKNYPKLLKLLCLIDGCRRQFRDSEAATEFKAEIAESLEGITASNFPVLSILFRAAEILQDKAVAIEAVKVLCSRYPEHPYLEPTVSSAAVESKWPDLIQCLPDQLRSKSFQRPEVQLLLALVTGDSASIFEAAERVSSDDAYEPLHFSQIIAEPFFTYPIKLNARHIHAGWPSIYGWEVDFAEQLAKGLSPGKARKKYLPKIIEYLGSDLTPELARELAELFEESQSFDGFLLYPAAFLEYTSPEFMAKFIIERCRTDPDNAMYFEEHEEAWLRFIPAIKVQLQALEPEDRAAVIGCLEGWGVPLQPTLRQRLNGSSLPDAVRMALEALERGIQSVEPDDLPYLQLALNKVAAAIPGMIAPAVADRVTVKAYNDMLSSSHLTEVGEKRMAKLTKRYGAAGVLGGIEALMNTPGFDRGADSLFNDLSSKLVELQGNLPNRRAYLAGVLRNRLPRLNSTWLDKQVVDAMKRGVDIEQMIELAKEITTWDEWAHRLQALRPY